MRATKAAFATDFATSSDFVEVCVHDGAAETQALFAANVAGDKFECTIEMAWFDGATFDDAPVVEGADMQLYVRKTDDADAVSISLVANLAFAALPISVNGFTESYTDATNEMIRL